MRNSLSFILAVSVLVLFALRADKCETNVNAPDTQKEQPKDAQ